MEIWVAHGDLIFLQILITLLPHDLGPKGFNSEREKFGLEGMTQTLTMTGASEGALPGVAGRIKLFILKSDRESYCYFSYRCLYLWLFLTLRWPSVWTATVVGS
jgi:hypothetical protein